jgi:hypothetical protein
MAQAAFAVPHFLGGELSQAAQGRFDKPDYRTSLRVCLNSFPVEIGPWTRRPGTMFAGLTLNGNPGRVIRFDFESAAPVTEEHTDGNLRFRAGPTIIGATLTTPYTNGSWAAIRPVQDGTTQILLTPTVPPQALVATINPGANPTFALGPVIFNDGPYLDPFTDGVEATPGALSGVITIELSFQVYVATTAYPVGAIVTYSSANYISLKDQNVGNTPSGGAPWWAATSASSAINGGKGFLGSDIGRLMRLFSEPPYWANGTTYAASTATVPVVVSYNPSGQAGATTYWQSLVGANVGFPPGSDLTHWQLVPQGAAIWTWGKITSLSNAISPSGHTSIGTMTGGGGLAGAFNGVLSQPAASSAELSVSGTGSFGPTSQITISSYAGKNFSGGQAIQHVALYPSSDAGFATGTVTDAFGNTSVADVFSVTFNLRGKATLPANSADGTLLATSGALTNPNSTINLVSSDQTTEWAYIWEEQVTVAEFGGGTVYTGYTFTNIIGQLSFYSPTGTGTGAGCNVEILGPPLLYTNPVVTWRLGVYTAGSLPTCGVYVGGRVWLGGAVANRFDACYANGITGSAINFAPTDQYGQVTAANAFDYTLDDDGVNPIFWMMQDLQGVLMGTQAGEWLVLAPTAGPISALNIDARNVTNHGSANIQPARTEHTKIFVQRFARKLLEYFPDVFSGKFSAPNLADKTIRTKPGIAELAYTSAVNPILWARMTDGSWASMTYKRDSLASSQSPTFYGWAGHTLGTGRIVESICSGPSVDGNLDALTMVTNDPATGQRWVEILTDVQDETTPLADSWFLDAGVVPAVTIGPNSATFSGLPFRNSGALVQVFCAGLDLGDTGEGRAPTDFVCAAGAVTVPYGDGISAGPGRGLFTQAVAQGAASQIIVGYTYNSDGQIVRPIMPSDSGSRAGPALGDVARAHEYAVLLVNTLGLQLGRDFNHLKPANLRSDPNNPATAPANLTTYSGIIWDSFSDDYSRNASPCFRVSRPFPATIVAINSKRETAA